MACSPQAVLPPGHCDHLYDLSIQCSPGIDHLHCFDSEYTATIIMIAGECYNGDVRLVDDDDQESGLKGRVQVCWERRWSSVEVCPDFWSESDASVVCRQLGHSPHGMCVDTNIQ